MAMRAPRRSYGFRQTGKLLETRIRTAGESRGFAVSRLLTHWDEIAGPDIAAKTRPLEVGYARKGFGATLTVLTTGAFAPLLEMQKERLRARVNGCYGYNAISRIRITQTAPQGFGEPQATYEPPKPQPTPAAKHAAAEAAQDVTSPELRAALARLGEKILSNTRSS